MQISVTATAISITFFFAFEFYAYLKLEIDIAVRSDKEKFYHFLRILQNFQQLVYFYMNYTSFKYELLKNIPFIMQ